MLTKRYSHAVERRFATSAFLKAALMVILWLGVSAEASSNSEFSEAELRQLAGGEVLVRAQKTQDASKAMIEASILINAPADKVWQVMTSCGEIPSFLPNVKSCSVLEKGDDWEIVRHEVKWIWLMPTLRYDFKATYENNRQIDISRVGGDLRELRGTWLLTSLNEGRQTLVNYSVLLDPGFFVPQWLVRRSLRKELPEVLMAFRKKVLEREQEIERATPSTSSLLEQ